MRAAALFALTSILALAGCHSEHVYDGSSSFYDQHPQYQDKPAYMGPADGVDPDPDTHAGRPF